MSHVEHLVVDTAAFITNSGLKVHSTSLQSVYLTNTFVQDIGAHLYTVAEVAEEIKSEQARLHAQLLPNEIEVRMPTDEAREFGVLKSQG